MILGVPKEIKDSEYRIFVTPRGDYKLINEGHILIIQREADKGS